jgi:hypothetical protein
MAKAFEDNSSTGGEAYARLLCYRFSFTNRVDGVSGHEVVVCGTPKERCTDGCLAVAWDRSWIWNRKSYGEMRTMFAENREICTC